ncbi:UNVERIFIED_CONTAM: hypothetical protein HDU68_011943 [Siphonaria sp. JEL0065]|nr:hypothetical protein HDU68_011943 [Siphonaria sp. JEL0065]
MDAVSKFPTKSKTLMSQTSTIENLFPGFTAEQKRNLLFYTVGIVCYKLGLESALGSIKTMMTERFNSNASTSVNAFATIGLLEGLNTLCQALGAIAVAPLVFKFKTPQVLAVAISFFAACCILFLVLEPATGGRAIEYIMKNGKRVPDPSTYGSWNPYLLFPVCFMIFIAYGIIELIRRVIPRDIVGGDAAKLKKMDSTVHIWNEVAGTGGAFFSAFMIQKLGHVYAMCAVPPLFIAAAFAWYKVTSPERKSKSQESPKRSPIQAMFHYIAVYFSSITTGARIIFSSRRFLWLLPGYTVGLVYHRYLEGGISPNFSKIVLGDSSFSQIMNGGSNFGEFLGALCVFFLNTQIKTPIPWVRWDAIALNLTWLLPGLASSLLVDGTMTPMAFAWLMAGVFCFISMGWSAGDVSLSAYVQSQLKHNDDGDDEGEVSPLGAVMAFLYASNIAIYFCLNYGLGKYLDVYSNRVKAIKDDKSLAFTIGIEPFYIIAGVLFSVGCVVIIAGTFIPSGSFALNPEILGGDEDNVDDEESDEGTWVITSK